LTCISILHHVSIIVKTQQFAPSAIWVRNEVKNNLTGLGVSLGRNIADRRKALGLTQAELAEQLGMDTVTISRFERGSHLPSLLRLEKIANELGLPLAELLSQSTNLCTDQSLLIQSWIAGLSEGDRKFLMDMIQAWCAKLKL
jgi:transcriptional regulator with XRE-family HTH domain